jgi:hypothetical protein
VEFYSSEEEQRKLVNLTNKTSITPLRLAVERERTQVGPQYNRCCALYYSVF